MNTDHANDGTITFLKELKIMKLKKINALIHDKQAYRIIIEDNESFEVVRADDPELTADKGKGRNNDFYREIKPLMFFSTDGVTLFHDSTHPINPKVHHLGTNWRSLSITEINRMVKIAEKTIELHKALTGDHLDRVGE